MNIIAISLLTLATLAQDSRERTAGCSCGGWVQTKDGMLTVGYKGQAIASTPVYRGKARLMGKVIDMTKKSKVTCVCRKKVKIPVWFSVPIGSYACPSDVCGDWVVNNQSLSAVTKTAGTVATFPIKDGIAKVQGKYWVKSLGEEIDLMAVQSIKCPCGRQVELREKAPPMPGPVAPKKRVKAGKKLGVVECGCGGKLTVHKNQALLSFKKKRIMEIPVVDGKLRLAHKMINLTKENKVTCACGENVTIPALLSEK